MQMELENANGNDLNDLFQEETTKKLFESNKQREKRLNKKLYIMEQYLTLQEHKQKNNTEKLDSELAKIRAIDELFVKLQYVDEITKNLILDDIQIKFRDLSQSKSIAP